MLCVRSSSFALLLVALVSVSAQADASFRVRIPPAAGPARPLPLKVAVTVPPAFAEVTLVTLQGEGFGPLVAQLTRPGLAGHSPDPLARELHLVLPKSAVGQERILEITGIQDGAAEQGFRWQDTPGKHRDLLFEDRPVLRYMYEALDDSSKERRQETMKVYHHLYDPQGKHLLTKGPGGLFQHHRGIFYGFNKITYQQGGEQRSADVWHCNQGESQTHKKFLHEVAGPVFARQLVQIHWNGKDGRPFATEMREIATYHVDGAQVVNFTSRLVSKVDNLKLDGDPQHAGFQFRATQYVPDNTQDQTYYVRPDGQGDPGKFRNWPDNPEHVDLPWLALSFVAHDQRYTCCYLDHPENPKPARFSERNYGRFGSYFVAQVESSKPLEVRYRLWLEPDALDVEQIEPLQQDFIEPPAAGVVKPTAVE